MSLLGDTFAAADLASQEQFAQYWGEREELSVGEITAQLAALEAQYEALTAISETGAEHLEEIRKIAEEEAARAEEVRNRLYMLTDEPTRSAGGDIAEMQPGEYIPTLPRTGDVVLSHQTEIPIGWLPCQGHQVYKGSYQKLYSVLANKYGVAAESDLFVLPSAADLPACSAVDEGKAVWIIRT